MSFVYRFARKAQRRNCFLIRIPCKCENIQLLFDYLYQLAKKVVVSNGCLEGPCNHCLLNYTNSATTVEQIQNDEINYNLIHEFKSKVENFCHYAIIYIGNFIRNL